MSVTVGRANRPNIMCMRHCVSSGHYLASQVGLNILHNGGNAVDAGVAAGIALNVVESQSCGFSGVAPIMIYLAETGELVTIDGLGVWPKAASCKYFADRGMDIVPEGILQSVVPGAPDAWLTALERFGTLSFAEVAEGAIRLAADGFPLHYQMAHSIRSKIADFPEGTAAADIFLPGGKPPDAGVLFVQSDLAQTLQFLADQENASRSRGRSAGIAAVREAYYRGDVARAIATHQRDNGGLVTEEDLASYRATVERPVSINFRGIDVYSCGPWCQGPLLLQALNMIKSIDPNIPDHNSIEYVHLLTEIIKLGAADKEAFYGDPKFVEVPLDDLLSEDYAARRIASIDLAKAHPGLPQAGRSDSRIATHLEAVQASPTGDRDLDTSYVCVVDSAGNAFSATPSDGVIRKSPVVPGWGIVCSPRGLQSRIDPNHPSSIAPGKRPRLTPNPSILVKPGEFVMPFGTPGGDLQTQAMLQVFLNAFVFGMDLQSAVEAPRFYTYSFPDSFSPHTYLPGCLRLEFPLLEALEDDLSKLGHRVEVWPNDEWPRTSVCAVHHNLQSGLKTGAADSRRTAYALGH